MRSRSWIDWAIMLGFLALAIGATLIIGLLK